VLGWPSSIGIENREGFTIEPFLTSSQLSGTQTQEFNLRPDELQKLPKQKEAVKVLGAMVRKGDQKMVVVADTQILSDDFLANSGENQTLVGNLIDWTAADPILSQIPKRTESRNGFKFSTPTQVLSVQWVGVLMPPMLVASLGAWWLNRRKRLSRRVYS